MGKRNFRTISKKRQLNPYIHRGLWKAVDTINDKEELENILLKKKI